MTESCAAMRECRAGGLGSQAVPLRALNLRAFREKPARAEICAPAVPLDLAVLSRPMVPAPFI